MALDSVHPDYTDMKPEWVKMRDVYRGERHVKEQGAVYLPPTKAMRLDGYGQASVAGVPTEGQEAYNAYRMRAVLPDYLKDTVEVVIGLLHSQPPVVELPAAMEPLREKITQLGEPIELLLRRINEEQLVTGRVGLLLDMPKKPDPARPMPYIALYVTEAIRNWDDTGSEGDTKLNMVILDESGYKRSNFDWVVISKYRVLDLELVGQDPDDNPIYGNYRQGVFETDGGGAPVYVDSDMKSPVIRANPLNKIPFVLVNTKDIVPTPDDPPLLGQANLALTIYRGEADYRQNLFMQGQDTLVVSGPFKTSAQNDVNELTPAASNETVRTGTGSMIHLEEGGKAEYIGISGEGLSEQREALESDRKRAENKSGALSAESDNSQASGEALRTRVAARTASLNQIAKTGAAALEWLLKVAAEWMGVDPAGVKVTPNMEFADFQMTGDNLNKLVAAKRAGAPLSWESIHALMAEGGVTKKSFQEENEAIELEQPEEPPAGTGAGGNAEDDVPAAAV